MPESLSLPDAPRPHAPHTTSEQWQSFELRMRRRRAERCRVRADVALDAGALDDAREAIAEAGLLSPDDPQLAALIVRLSAVESPAPGVSAAAPAAEIPAPPASIKAIDGIGAIDSARAPRRRRALARAAVVVVLTSSAAGGYFLTRQQGWALGRSPAQPNRPVTPVPAASESARPPIARSTVGAVGDLLPSVTLAETSVLAPEFSSPLDTAGTVSGTSGLTPGAAAPTFAAAAATAPATDPVAPSAAPPESSRSSSLPLAAPPSAPPPTPAPVAPPAASLPLAAQPLSGTLPSSLVLGEVAPPAAVAPAVRAGNARAEPEAASAGAALGAVPDERLVRATLNRYEAAYSGLNAAAASAVWPSVDQRSLTRAFDGLSSQSIALGQCRVEVTGAGAAIAECAGTARWTPKVGGGAQSAARRWRFDLSKTGADWIIAKADVR